jgi:hypothetical protein
MARKLKTYQTSLGFFDLAIAAPSMKAALEAWGADSNLFHQGAANESDDPVVIAATMAKPGVILKRPVGSDGAFSQHAELPTDLGDAGKPAKKAKGRQSKRNSSQPADKAAERKAAIEYDRGQRLRDRERARQEAAAHKERERRQKAVDSAQEKLNQAKRQHDDKVAIIEAERDAVEKRAKTEEARWEQERQRLEQALRRARN